MIGDRLKETREHGGFSLEIFCSKLNISKRTLQNYEKNTSEPTVKTLLIAAEICHVNDYWLLTGKGSMLENGNNIPTVCNTHTKNCDDIAINFYPDVYAAAGYGAINGDASPKKLSISKPFLDEIVNVRNYKKLDIIRVYGDSMEPYISNGEYVIIEKITEARNGETVICNINGEVFIKRYKSDPFKKWVKLQSNNGTYEDIHIEGDNLQLLNIVGVVRAKIKPF